MKLTWDDRIHSTMGGILIRSGESGFFISEKDFEKYGSILDGISEIVLSANADKRRKRFPEAFVTHSVDDERNVSISHGPGQYLRTLYPGDSEILVELPDGRKLTVRHCTNDEVIDAEFKKTSDTSFETLFLK